MAVGTTQIFLGSTPIPFYYLGENQISYEPKTAITASIPTNGLIALFDATNVESYPGSGSLWKDLTPNKLWAAAFSSSVFPTFNSTNKEFILNGTTNALMVPFSSSIGTGSSISTFTEIMWIKIPTSQLGLGNAFGVINLQTVSAASVNFDAISWNQDQSRWRLTSDNNNRNVTSVQTETVFNSYLMIASTRTIGTDNFKIYRNGGTEIATGSFTPLTYSTSTNGIQMSIGNRFYNSGAPAWSSDGWISGSISSVFLYNRVLSSDELNQIYNAGRTGISL